MEKTTAINNNNNEENNNNNMNEKKIKIYRFSGEVNSKFKFVNEKDLNDIIEMDDSNFIVKRSKKSTPNLSLDLPLNHPQNFPSPSPPSSPLSPSYSSYQSTD